MLECDGYKMFRGTVRVTPVIRSDGTRWREPFDLEGDWLNKPEYPDIWYCQPADGGLSQSFTKDVLSEFRETLWYGEVYDDVT